MKSYWYLLVCTTSLAIGRDMFRQFHLGKVSLADGLDESVFAKSWFVDSGLRKTTTSSTTVVIG